jgi:hypothetical protein
MLIRRIYIMSLEHPGPGFYGVLGTVGDKTSLIALKNFVAGYGMCQHDYSLEEADTSWLEFLEWLRSKGYFPTIGWAGKIIEECGDGDPAFSKFIELLYEYIELLKPNWFFEFNQTPQSSFWRKSTGPRSTDIRIERHIKLAARHV